MINVEINKNNVVILKLRIVLRIFSPFKIYALIIMNIQELDMEILYILGKTILFYVLLIFILRIMGKREVGELSIFDVVVSGSIQDTTFWAMPKPHFVYCFSILIYNWSMVSK